MIIDLKLGEFTHADAGQMHLYLNYAREHWVVPGENPPVGLILCAEKDAAVARYALEYFTHAGRFDDWAVHEAAHVFHDQKRRYLDLPFTRYRERLLHIDFCKRETFAYGCEFYSHIVAHARSRRERESLLAEWRQSGPWGSSQQVDWAELQDVVAEAVAARNGWKRILARCAPPPRRPMRVWIAECARQALSREGAREDP